MNAWKQLISDAEGCPSAMRVALLVIVIPVMVVWTVLSIRNNEFIVPPPGIITVLVTAISGKAIQSFSENFSAPKTIVTAQTWSPAAPGNSVPAPVTFVPSPNSTEAPQSTTTTQKPPNT